MTTAPHSDRPDLDTHFCEMVRWHFSEETGTPFWLDWQKTIDWDPTNDVKSFADIVRFPHFDGELLRTEPHERFVPRAYLNRPYTIFETGGTTGMPKQRVGWDDYKLDYEQFSASLSDASFPPGGNWLMVGPTGPRRLRLAIEHLANFRGSSCYFVDLDPRWVKKLIKSKQFDQAKAYMTHVVDQAELILKHRKVTALFTTPKLLEELGDRMSLVGAGIKGRVLRRHHHDAAKHPLYLRRNPRRRDRVRADLRKHTNGPRGTPPHFARRQLLHHLLRTTASRCIAMR